MCPHSSLGIACFFLTQVSEECSGGFEDHKGLCKERELKGAGSGEMWI